MSKEGFVNIHGKEYKTVAKRVQEFREQYKDYAIITDIVKIDEEQCIMRASIYKVNEDGNGVTLATGHGCEFKSSSQINRTSYVENCETSAIGRALACFGLGGTEFASADEVANAIHQQKTVHAPTQSITPTAGALDNFSAADKDIIYELSDSITHEVREGAMQSASDTLSSLDNEQKTAVWSLLSSQTRSALKKFKESK